MINAILFIIAFLWLLALTVKQAKVSYWLKIWHDEHNDERNKVLIEKAKATCNKKSQQEKEPL